MEKVKRFFAGVLVCLTVGGVGHVFAATSNGCDEEANDRITPELALCSTHIYNIGGTENVPSGNSDKQLMRDVVALKTTVMTQQMNKQYEYLEAMIRRFKTQLEKAVLTTSLQAKGASSSSGGSSSSSFKSNDRSIYLAGVSNCNNELTSIKVFECLNNNLNQIYNMSNNGTNLTMELRKQLANDYSVAAKNYSGVWTEKDEKCEAPNNLGSRSVFQECLDGLRAGVRKGYEAAQRDAKQQEKK
ncbi:MAG: hypothetical protein IJD69_00235 [Alphaproteobacteria bacterium]|nr:hypothetical protein [Alphaproteobacteria bacterium]